jgi:hypothetical protein
MLCNARLHSAADLDKIAASIRKGMDDAGAGREGGIRTGKQSRVLCSLDPEAYCSAPDRFNFHGFELRFPARTKPDGKADLAVGEDAGEGAFLIATASAVQQPNIALSIMTDTPSTPFASFQLFA